MSLGATHRQTKVIIYLWTAEFAVSTVVAAFAPLWVSISVGAIILALSLVLIGWIWKSKKNRLRNPGGSNEAMNAAEVLV